MTKNTSMTKEEANDSTEKMMTVVATAKGYAGQMRDVGGEPFEVPDTPENHKATWFKPVAKADL